MGSSIVLIASIIMLLTIAAGTAYWWFRHSRIRRYQTALQLCANREESARAICWQSMLTLAELLRFDHPDVEVPRQLHRRLVRHVQSSRTATADHAEATIDMLAVLCEISSHDLRQDHDEARVRMLDAAGAWRETLKAREAAEQALKSSRQTSTRRANEPTRSPSKRAVPS